MLGLKLIHVNDDGGGGGGGGGAWNIPAPAPEGEGFKAICHTFNVFSGVL